jgi:lipopolysaccharide transport system ATP-binding protein
MSRPAIVVDSLSKSYQIGRKADAHASFRDAIVGAVTSPFRKLKRLGGEAPSDETFWALKDVSFEVQPGEVVGVIGRNGAGKSTLLKILSRITEPTSGEVRLRGRVASLLEVGTGFHPELSGRENIYLNGAILGMKRAEIDRKFDEIVAFAEIEKFLYTPVKRYSSGMYVRLAFSVAAHLDSEILIVDEVLAVGDAEFQKKCLGKMKDVTQKSGKTVLFVSHNMAAVSALCSRGIVLRNGGMSANEDVGHALAYYLDSLEASKGKKISEMTERRGEGRIRLRDLSIRSGDYTTSTIACGGPARIQFMLDGVLPSFGLTFTLYDYLGNAIASFNSDISGPDDHDALRGGSISCEFDEVLLVPGRYRMNVAVRGDGALQDHIEGVSFFEIVPGTVRGRPVSAHNPYAKFTMPHRWVGERTTP